MAAGAADGPWGRQDNVSPLIRASQVAVQHSLDLQAFAPITPSQWQGKEPPARDWLVDRCFLKGTVGMVSGDGGIGKSLLLQQLATCACLGRMWLGLSVKPGRALVLACEDDQDELWRRQAAINKHLNCEMDDLTDAGLFLYPRVGQDNGLMRLDRASWDMKPTQMFERLRSHCQRNGVTYVIIDTATQTFSGNQNDERQVMQFLTELRRLAMTIQGVVVLTKHPSRSGRLFGDGESGNVAWSNSVRSRYYLHREKKTKQLFFDAKKSNYGPLDIKLPLKWERGVYVVDQPTLPLHAH